LLEHHHTREERGRRYRDLSGERGAPVLAIKAAGSPRIISTSNNSASTNLATQLIFYHLIFYQLIFYKLTFHPLDELQLLPTMASKKFSLFLTVSAAGGTAFAAPLDRSAPSVATSVATSAATSTATSAAVPAPSWLVEMNKKDHKWTTTDLRRLESLYRNASSNATAVLDLDNGEKVHINFPVELANEAREVADYLRDAIDEYEEDSDDEDGK
jgi:hypothetical protein